MATKTRECTPNHTLVAVRTSLNMTQEEFAEAVRQAGDEIGVPNGTTKQRVQSWERGRTGAPRAATARALEHVTGRPIAALGFDVMIPAFVEVGDPGESELLPVVVPGPKPAARDVGEYSGIWLSKYVYVSSGRANSELIGMHYVVVTQHGARLSVQSLPQGSLNPDSPLVMDLSINKNVVTGTWTEDTAKDGYYRGASYHGAIQMLADMTGRKMKGQWVGFGKEFDVNTGPWELVFQESELSKRTFAKYNRMPNSGQ